MSNTHRILHMASFSRSGETLLLRCLDAHPAIHVVHQIKEPDRDCDLELFRFLMNYEPVEINSEHPLIKKCGVKKGATILLKNAVWTHQYPFNGFILCRNPFAVIQSFKLINESPEKKEQRKSQIIRWARNIDPKILPAIPETDHIEMICMLYNLKMHPLTKLNLPIIRYEDFVKNPEATLKALLKKLSIPWDDIVLNSHKLYNENDIGHGKIKLWQPIHCNSLKSWKKNLTRGVISRIYGITAHVMKDYGYTFKEGNLLLDKLNDNIKPAKFIDYFKRK